MLHDFSKDEFDIVIQAGQSNADGTGFGTAKTPYVPKETVWYLNQDFTVARAAESVAGNGIRGDFSLAFADCYLADGRLAPGRKLLILRTAVGGTGFADHRWGPTEDLYLQMLEMTRTALTLNSANRLVAFLWHQGETDACAGADRDTHCANLHRLFTGVQEAFSCRELPFIAGDFVPQWNAANSRATAPVLAAIREVCHACEKGAFVETDGLISNAQAGVNPEDTIHFCRQALYELGQRYYAAFASLC